MELPKVTLSEPFKPYATGAVACIKFHDGNHTPERKNPGEVKSIVECNLTRCALGDTPYVEIRMEELTTQPSGRVVGRTIAAVIPMSMALRMAKFIITGE